jgi:hypothetical protein
MDTAEFRKQILEIKEIIEYFLLKTLPPSSTQVENFSEAVNVFNQDLSTLHDSLLTIINYFTLQQNAIRALMTLDKVIQTNQVKVQSSDHLIHTLRMVILPQIEIFVQNIFSAVKAKNKVQKYLQDSPNLNRLPEIIDDLVAKDQTFLDIIQLELGTESSLLQESLQSILMSHLDVSREKIDTMKENLRKTFGPEPSDDISNSSSEKIET